MNQIKKTMITITFDDKGFMTFDSNTPSYVIYQAIIDSGRSSNKIKNLEGITLQELLKSIIEK